MTIDRNYRGVRSQVTWAEEVPVEQALSGGTVSDNTITGLSGMTVDKYAGQVAIAVPLSQPMTNADGKKFHIISNTASAITFEEDVEVAGLAASYTLAISQRNVTVADLSAYFGHVEESEMPERKLDMFKGYYKGATVDGNESLPYRHDIIPLKASYESSIPLRLVNGRILAMAMGWVDDDGTNAGTFTNTSVTTARVTVPGQRTITSSGAHGLSSGNYVSIGTAGTDAEIRQCTTGTTPAGTTIVLSSPLRREHANGSAIYSVTISGAGYITHKMKPYDMVPYWQLKRSLYSYKSSTLSQDYCKIYRGLKVKSLELSINPGDAPLQATIGVVGLSIDDTEVTRETVEMGGYTGKTPYIHKGAVTKINDITYKQSGEFSGSVEREMETKWYHDTKHSSIALGSDQTTGYLDPTEHIEGSVASNFTVNMPLHNKNMWEMLKAMTVLGNTPETSHTLSRGTNDTMQIRFYDVFLTEGSEGLPKEGEIPLSLAFDASYPIVTIKDQIYWY